MIGVTGKIEFRGKIEKGMILALEPVGDEFEGMNVKILLEDEVDPKYDSSDAIEGRKIRDDWDQLMKTIRENQIDTDITDMAHQHDHYLYGTPKRDD